MQHSEALAEKTSARDAWDRIGTVLIPDVLAPERFKDIQEEALARTALATPHIHDHTASHRDGSFASPVHCSFIEPGPKLQALAYDKTFLTALRRATGIERLVPRGGAVVLYEEGDFQGLHTDSVKTTVTVAFALTENLPAMGWAPHLYNAFPDLLGKVVAEHGMFPEDGEFTTLEHPFGACGAVRAFAGYSVPHWRSPMPDGSGAGLLATMPFIDL
ncbi:hypothetical protein [Streptomyces sp. NPDC058254]|uniref:hypothetical protein n=1 Tax=Streptomyces sp. NPDC058254 TaxID=3346406 RepID=UPI0036E4D175